jgi:hypothetical protein
VGGLLFYFMGRSSSPLIPNYCGLYDNAGDMMNVDEKWVRSFQVKQNMGVYVGIVIANIHLF